MASIHRKQAARRRSGLRLRQVLLNLHGAGTPCREIMPEPVCAEIIYYRERAVLAREKADAATAPETKKNHLAAEARCAATNSKPGFRGPLAPVLLPR
jgi:hypothetical protein